MAASSPLSLEKPGDRIGRYKLLQKLGEGGCGSVHMAEQEEPVKRRVALKVTKLGMDTVRRVLADKAVCGYYTQVEPPTPGVWPAVIDETSYWRAQSALGFSKRQIRPARSEANLFTGLAQCGCC